ncbi:hypothetical protein OUZ56_004298 [Daphnia magna]|uniref:Uncharacterized protein n=1 Tax=Daphnia magna TaxID=35525 RepID=A0ABQ9YPC8_9CRUS|nr:hypothetical protein OUZ56_004298 [Daphnia magna]
MTQSCCSPDGSFLAGMRFSLAEGDDVINAQSTDNLSRSSARPRLPKEIPFDEEFHQLNEAFPKRRKANI